MWARTEIVAGGAMVVGFGLAAPVLGIGAAFGLGVLVLVVGGFLLLTVKERSKELSNNNFPNLGVQKVQRRDLI